MVRENLNSFRLKNRHGDRVMSISDADFFTFYQNFLAVIVAEGDGDMSFTVDLFWSGCS